MTPEKASFTNSVKKSFGAHPQCYKIRAFRDESVELIQVIHYLLKLLRNLKMIDPESFQKVQKLVSKSKTENNFQESQKHKATFHDLTGNHKNKGHTSLICKTNT